MKKYKGFFLLERIPKAPLHIFAMGDAAFVNPYFKKVYGLKKTPGPDLAIFEGEDYLFHYNLDKLRLCTANIFEKLVGDPGWGLKMNVRIVKNAKAYFDHSASISRKNLNRLTNDELASVLHQWFFKYFKDSWVSGWPAVLVDFERNLFSNYLINYLKQKAKRISYSVSVGDVFSILTTPAELSFAQKETISLLNLLEQVQTDKKLLDLFSDGEINKILNDLPSYKIFNKSFEKHFQSFCWLPFMYVGPAWKKEYFIESLKGLVRQKVKANQQLKILKEKMLETKKLQNKYTKDLAVHQDFQLLFEVARGFVYSKSYRKDAMYYSCFVLDKLLREVARRTYLSIVQVRRVFPWEMKDLLLGKGPNAHQLNERKFAVQYSADNAARRTFEGERARAFVKNIGFVEQKKEQVKNILGDCASVGKVRGVVKIVDTPADMNKMAKGNILVSYATSPDIMPAIRKAAAIVTDLGGIICHAAIVSRELHIPCVVGTKLATQILKDGDLVEVDATHGIIRLIK